MKEASTSKRGRPATPLLDRLRVVVWSHYVMKLSGASTAEEFELGYVKARGKIHLSRGLWSRYLRGETLPQGAFSGGRRSLIERFNSEFPETKDIFFHPIWKLLDFGVLLGPDQLLQKYLRLDEDVWLQFVACIETSNPYAARKPATFWSNLSPAIRKMRLSNLSGLDGIAACLIEARIGHLSQVEERFVKCLLYAKPLFQALTQQTPFDSLRVKSALLAMEGYCIAYLERISGVACSNGENYTLLRSKKSEWQRDWGDRCKAHSVKLSPSSLAAFKVWLTSAVAIDSKQPAKIGYGLLLWD